MVGMNCFGTLVPIVLSVNSSFVKASDDKSWNEIQNKEFNMLVRHKHYKHVEHNRVKSVAMFTNCRHHPSFNKQGMHFSNHPHLFFAITYFCNHCNIRYMNYKVNDPKWPLTPYLVRSYVQLYLIIIMSRFHECTSMTIFLKNLSQKVSKPNDP